MPFQQFDTWPTQGLGKEIVIEALISDRLGGVIRVKNIGIAASLP